MSDHEPTMCWDGITQSSCLGPEDAALRHTLADHAKSYEWTKMLGVLSEERDLVNSIRPNSTAWYTPLHQAAHGGAHSKVISSLLRRGASRTLRNAAGERAVDIARRKGHKHLLAVLNPVYERNVQPGILAKIQRNFHAVIRNRAGKLVDEHALRLPDLEPLLETRLTTWFAVPGFYGGFHYWLSADGPNAKLVSDSWCRVIGGSGQRHEVDAQGSSLVDQGFV